MALLSLRDVSLAFGGPKLLDHAELQIERNERLCLLGRNGEGKSTLLKILEGSLAPDEGEVLRQQGLTVTRLPQEVPEGRTGTVAEEVALGVDDHGHPASPDDYRVLAVISKIGLDPDARFDQLSSGMKRRVLLARSIVGEPDILLLDEPTNHLDIDSIRWLEDFLQRYTGTLVFVTHDRVFLERLATRIVELDRGHLYDWPCDYQTFLKRREEVLATEEKRNALFDKRLAQEETWIRKGVEARRTRNEGRVRALKAMRESRQQRREKQGTARVQVQEAERSGTLVVEAKNVGFAYSECPVITGLSTLITRGDKVGIVGPNGSGKTTLLRLLLDTLAPTSGSLRLGTNREVAYFDQLKAELDDERSVQDNVSDGYDTVKINGQPRHIVGYLQDFLFAPERSRTQVKYLSGGERSRLLLARLFTKPSNVLVLDEPTNDLDVETLELLETLLVDYQGTVLIVSHDRAFLNGVAASLLVVGEGGVVREFDGGYDDYLRQIAQEAAAAPKAVAGVSVKSAGPAEPLREKIRKLNNKERRELDELPGRIERMEADRKGLHDSMADPAFYKKSPTEISESKARLDALEADLRMAYDRWERLESMA